MNVLADSCVAAATAEALRQLGHEVLWAGSFPKDPGDREILARAISEARILVTLDKDFGEFAVLEGVQHSGIVRLVDIPLREQAARCHDALAANGALLRRGGLVTIERFRTRVREPEPLDP